MNLHADDQDFRTTASIETLKRRAKLIKRIRQFFDDRNFFEVETPLLSSDIVVDRYLEPIALEGNALDIPATQGKRLWLQTSPEFGMKRILASGATAIYQITKSFRTGEWGKLHNPEFTMLEWYRIDDDMHQGMDLLAEFVESLLATPATEKITYQQAFLQHADLDPFAASSDDFLIAARNNTVELPDRFDELDLDFWRNLILTQAIEPNLGSTSPVIIYDWPASQSALAQIRHDNPPVAERFELYYQGIELANGYHELLDANELLKRNQQINAQRISDGKAELPTDSRLLSAMATGFPPCSGVALGIDRLIMLATQSANIRDVMSFDIETA